MNDTVDYLCDMDSLSVAEGVIAAEAFLVDFLVVTDRTPAMILSLRSYYTTLSTKHDSGYDVERDIYVMSRMYVTM